MLELAIFGAVIGGLVGVIIAVVNWFNRASKDGRES